jgi:uncharacterized Ntn-hydrolase superfamily protein
MTWSILARDDDGTLNVAMASCFFAVGALCVPARRGVGALATQALMDPVYNAAGLALLERGEPAAAIVAALTASDDGRDQVLTAADLRLDDHAEPFVELRRLYAVSLQWFRPFLAVPGRRYPSGVTDRAEGEGRIEASHAARVAPTQPPL